MKNSISIKYGILAGIATISYYLLFYWFKAESIFYLGIWWAGWLPSLIIMVLGVLKVKKAQAGALSYLEALRAAFLIYVIGMFLFYAFYFVLLKYIDPELLQAQQDVALRNYERFSRGTEQEKEQLQELYSDDNPTFRFSTLLMGYLGSLIGGFIVSLATAYATKTR